MLKCMRKSEKRVTLITLSEQIATQSGGLATLKTLSEQMSTQIGGLDARVGILDTSLSSLSDRVADLDTGLSSRITELDSSLSGRIAEVDTNLSGRIAELDTNLSGRITDLDNGLSKKIDDRFDELARVTNTSFQAVEDRMTGLQDGLQERIDDVGKAVLAIHGITDAIFAEIKLIREEIHTVDTREGVADLEDRVAVLEKKAGIRK
jgi:chromosome segregation ATPase